MVTTTLPGSSGSIPMAVTSPTRTPRKRRAALRKALDQFYPNRDAIPESSLAELREASRFVWELANRIPWQHQPYVGDSAFAHKGGMHVSAVTKHPETYEHVNPEKIGNHRRVLVSELAGQSNILWKASQSGVDLSKNTPEVRQLLQTLKEMENKGFEFEGADASFQLLMEK